MATFGRKISIGVAAAFMLASLATSVQGQVPGGMGSLGGESRGIMYIKGSVVCAECTLDEARKAHPGERSKLYQLSHKQGQVVVKITEVNDSPRWSHLGRPQLWVRAKDSVFAQLTAEENLFKEIQITGLLNNTRTLDIFEVTIYG